MKMMSKADFRADVLGAGVDSFIVQGKASTTSLLNLTPFIEYKNASEQCENISDAEPSNQYAAQSSPSRALIWALASDFLRDLPMVPYIHPAISVALLTKAVRRIALSALSISGKYR